MPTSSGLTPLYAAATGGHLNVVKQLLAAGADVRARIRGVGAAAAASALCFFDIAEAINERVRALEPGKALSEGKEE